ncbi:MAG: beta-N-acetylhexosaminidase [Betaproteobacteria bacterium]|nr:beta-N-acetylhexosaminidase [Betaproteobacteria bacterium]
MSKALPLGPAVIDPVGLSLSDEDRERLTHPAVGAVILFAHNYESPAQLRALCAEIKALRSPELLICVDHEGGRVQRFRNGFTAIPPMRKLGKVFDSDNARALRLAEQAGITIGCELAAHGVDFSFTPVLDLDYGASSVIGDRALHAEAAVAGELAAALIRGLASAGVAAVGKHYPGHGYAIADSHVAVPYDDRPLAAIMARDVAPYRPAIAAGLAGVMPAHVIFQQVDREPAGYSAFWLRKVLRGELGFHGTIFSDDLSMEGASVAGGLVARAHAALDAGCDVVLLCKDPKGQDELLAGLGEARANAKRWERMRARRGALDRSTAEFRAAAGAIVELA